MNVESRSFALANKLAAATIKISANLRAGKINSALSIEVNVGVEACVSCERPVYKDGALNLRTFGIDSCCVLVTDELPTITLQAGLLIKCNRCAESPN